MRRVRAHSSLLVLMTLALVLTLARSAAAEDVPFGVQQVISTGASYAYSVFPADVDGDGDLDVLSASTNDDKIAWYENTDGAGTFGSQLVISTATTQARSVHAADLDGDGDLDVLSASNSDDKIAWYENTDGTGTFGTQQVISTAAAVAYSVFAADVDGDGDLDVLSASLGDDKIAWYENTDGTGTFGTQQVISTAADAAMSVYVADVDGDGDLDALSASFLDGKIAWYENTDGAGAFGPQLVISTAATEARSVHAADLDGDGDLDVLSASTLGSGAAWYENTNGTGSFGPQREFDNPGSSASVHAADVDSDGDLDVLVASFSSNSIVLYENTDGAGSFGARRDISAAAAGATCVFAADVDGDGDLDALSSSAADNKIAWYENRTIHRSAAFPEQSVISTAADFAVSVSAADVDGDGDPDVLSASFNDDKIAWYENTDGAGSFGTQQIISTAADGAVSFFAADVDGDGDLDVLSSSHLADKFAWYENTNGAGSFGTEQVISTAADGAASVFAADVDGDGDLDALSASLYDDKIAWYENTDGAGSFGTQQIISTAADFPYSAFAADVDGDGDLDVFSSSNVDDKIAWYENTDGAGSFGAQQVISTAADGAISVFAADVDADGDLDVLSASSDDDKIAWYENTDGAGSFGPQQVISTAADGPYLVFAADADGDGDLDVLSASWLDDKIAWYENTDGAGSFGPQQVISTAADNAYSVFVADVDGDGDLDVLSASWLDDKIAWYENQGGQFALSTADTAPAALLQGDTSDLLEITMTHRGIAADGDEELATLALLFEETAGDPLTSPEANALIESLAVYRDTGSGVFEAGSDTLVASLGTLSLTAGTQTLTLPDDDAGAQVAHGTPGTFFVVVTLTSDAQAQAPNRFVATHVAESGSTAEDWDHDIPLTLEFVADFTSRTVLTASPGSDADSDGLLDLYEMDTGVYVSPTDTGTDPLDSDTDADGLTDGDEVSTHSTDPLTPDTDGDGLSDGDEIDVYSTEPLDPDTDGDGFIDGDEVIVGADPNDPNSTLVGFGAMAALNTNAAIDSGADYNPQVATDGAGNWVAIWSSEDDLQGTIGTDKDILVSRSDDDGATWTAPVKLNTNAATDSGDDGYQQVTADGAGNWVAIWSSEDDLQGTIGTDKDILISRSSDAGATWTAPAALNTNAATDLGNDLSPQVTTDGAGNWVAVWESLDSLGDTIDTDYDILVSRSSDDGATWSPPAALNTNAVSDSGPDVYAQVATDGVGNWVAVWESNDFLGDTIGLDSDILVSRSSDSGATWTAPAALNTNAAADSGNDSFPQMTTDEAGSWVAVWGSDESLGSTIGPDYDILISRSSDAGVTWTAPAALNTNAATDSGTDSRSQVTTDGVGNWVAVWYSNDDLGVSLGGDWDVLVSRSSDAGASWTTPTVLNANAASDSGNDINPQVTTDRAGNWVTVWHSDDWLGDTIGTDADILFATGSGPDTDGDGLTDGAEVNVHGTEPLDPDTDSDGLSDGDEVDVYSTEPLDPDTDGDGFIDGDEVIVGADPNDPNSTLVRFGAVAALGTNAATDSETDGAPQVTTDEAGNWVAVWYSYDDLGGTIGTDRDILVSRSSDDGASWTAPAALNTNAATDSGNDGAAQVATDGAGNWVAIWSSTDELVGTIGADYDILIARSSDAGATWTPPAALNTNAATDSGNDGAAQVATDGAGNWVAVWQSTDELGGPIGADYDILVARSSDNGATWTPPVALNTNATTDSEIDQASQVTTDGAGNWMAVWYSDNSLGSTIGTDWDILVARSSDDGATWSAPAALNTNATTDSGHDWRPQVTTDGAGNWVTVWFSDNSLGGTIDTDQDILVACSSDAGVTWTPPVALNTNAATDSGEDQDPEVTTEGAGNWVAVWDSEDSLGSTIGTDWDILVARSSDAGVTWTPPVALGTNAATDSGDDYMPQVTTDGAGRWVAVWQSTDDLGSTIGTDYDILFSTGSGPDTDGDGLSDGAEVTEHGTEPLDPDTDDDGLNDGDEITLGTDPNDEDTDDDGVCDGNNQVGTCTTAGPDNCPFVGPADQTNSDALPAGDVCQCGDLDDDGPVEADDVLLARQHLMGTTVLANPTRCNVTGPSDGGLTDCDVADIFVLQRVVAGRSATLENTCQAYTGP